MGKRNLQHITKILVSANDDPDDHYMLCVKCELQLHRLFCPQQLVTVNPILLKPTLYMALTTNVSSAYVNAPISVSAVAQYPNKTNVGPGYVITLTCSPSGGSFGISSGTTGYTKAFILVSGIYTTFTASAPGTYTIKATVHDPDGTYFDGVGNQTVTIIAAPTTPVTDTPTPEPPTATPPVVSQQAAASTQASSATPTATAVSLTPTPTLSAANTTAALSGDNGMGGLTAYLPYIVGAIIIILLILLIFLYLWTKKTLKIMPKETTAPCDGKTEIPVKVMFVNGFGGSKKPRSDVEVEMRSTAGTIKNVVLPSSRDFAEATLIAPT